MLTKYRAYLLLERGLSDNTRDAYSHDVERFLDFLREEQLPPEAVQLDDLHRFTWTLHDIGISPRSIARILAGIRSFYRGLLPRVRVRRIAEGDLPAFPLDRLLCNTNTPEEWAAGQAFLAPF